MLCHRIGGRGRRRHLDDLWIADKLFAQLLDIVGQGCREKQGLAQGRQQTDYALNIGNETHIQHIDQKNLMTLSIKFQEGSWLIINYDDDYETPIIDSYFTAGEEYELLFDAPISLTLDNAQSTTAFLNGLEIDLSENVNKYNSSTLVINDG